MGVAVLLSLIVFVLYLSDFLFVSLPITESYTLAVDRTLGEMLLSVSNALYVQYF